eukprot:1757184-Prorocentrum_lima.AAC.1
MGALYSKAVTVSHNGGTKDNPARYYALLHAYTIHRGRTSGFLEHHTARLTVVGEAELARWLPDWEPRPRRPHVGD